jgi:hypothetical protein
MIAYISPIQPSQGGSCGTAAILAAGDGAIFILPSSFVATCRLPGDNFERLEKAVGE